jgi:glyoxylase-like metal-dependent hydrolase (beta-lactamase superfamily II)
MEIKYVIDTHIQADHLSGGRSLSEKTGAQYCLETSADVGFAFTSLSDGQELEEM